MAWHRNSVGLWVWSDSNGETGTNNPTNTVVTRKQSQKYALEKNSEVQKDHSKSCTDSLDRDGSRGIDRGTFEQTVKRMQAPLWVCIWATRALCTPTKVFRWIVLAIFIKALCFEYNASAITNGLVECAKGRNASSCTELKDGFFPSSSIDHSYRIKFKLADPDAMSEALIDVDFPLPLRNPIIPFVLLLSSLIIEYLLPYLCDYLLAISAMVDASIINQALPEGPDLQLQRP